MTFEFGGTTANLMKSCERTYDDLKVLEKIILGDIPIHVPEKASWAMGGTACYINEREDIVQLKRIYLIRDIDNSLKLLESYSPSSALSKNNDQNCQLIRNLLEIADQRVENFVNEREAELKGYVELSTSMPC